MPSEPKLEEEAGFRWGERRVVIEWPGSFWEKLLGRMYLYVDGEEVARSSHGWRVQTQMNGDFEDATGERHELSYTGRWWGDMRAYVDGELTYRGVHPGLHKLAQIGVWLWIALYVLEVYAG